MGVAPRWSTLEGLKRRGYLSEPFAVRFNSCRPRPPVEIVRLVQRMRRAEEIDTVVDLGSGTGLSAAIWSLHASSVIGVEPSEAMRFVASANNSAANVKYVDGYAEDTGLPDRIASVVVAASSMNWFSQPSVYAEVDRLLQPGGAFVIYYYDWPPRIHPVIDKAFEAHVQLVDSLAGGVGGRANTDILAARHADLDLMRASGIFYRLDEREIEMADTGNASRVVRLALSSGSVTRLLAQGVSEESIGLDVLRQKVSEELRSGKVARWEWRYTALVGIKGPGRLRTG